MSESGRRWIAGAAKRCGVGMAAAAGLVADLSLNHGRRGMVELGPVQRAGIAVVAAMGGAGAGLLLSSALVSAPVVAQTVAIAAAGAIVAFAIDEALTRVLEARRLQA